MTYFIKSAPPILQTEGMAFLEREKFYCRNVRTFSRRTPSPPGPSNILLVPLRGTSTGPSACCFVENSEERSAVPALVEPPRDPSNPHSCRGRRPEEGSLADGAAVQLNRDKQKSRSPFVSLPRWFLRDLGCLSMGERHQESSRRH